MDEYKLLQESNLTVGSHAGHDIKSDLNRSISFYILFNTAAA